MLLCVMWMIETASSLWCYIFNECEVARIIYIREAKAELTPVIAQA